MEFLIESIFFEILAVLVGALLSYLATTFFWRRIIKFKERRRWGIRDSANLEIIVSLSCKKEEEETRTTIRATGQSQIYALSVVAPSLITAYGQLTPGRILFPDEYAVREDADILVIGGPINNELAEEVFERTFLTAGIAIIGEKVVVNKGVIPEKEFYKLDRPSGEGLFPSVADRPVSSIADEALLGRDSISYLKARASFVSSIPGVDSDNAVQLIEDSYGLVVRANNPFVPNRRMLLISGSDQWGTMAAARFFGADEFISIKGKRDHVYLIRTDQTAYGMGHPKLVADWAIKAS
ncbi:MAG: hypothetical protein ABW087_07040 [Candidatus Thiodiazotropha sp.]